jgi:putative tryptophan/tyrosine transport system substrate-binding protein
MRRRELMALLGSAIVWPLAAHAQQKGMPVIGSLSIFSPPANPADLLRDPIHEGMGEMGFVEGQNMRWEYRWAELHYDRLPALAADLVSRKVDLIVTIDGGTPAIAGKSATSTIPIVFIGVSDPVGLGLVASLSRPGGNLTGFSILSVELMPKRLDLLCELVPQAAAIALLVNPDSVPAELYIRATEEAARAKGVRLDVLKARNEGEIDPAFEQLHSEALLVQPNQFLASRRDQLVALATRRAVPVMSWYPGFVAAGGLISYGPDTDTLFRQAGIYAGKILKGAKPADLPVQQPTTFQLVINLNTAKALGLTIPPSILARTDQVIE